MTVTRSQNILPYFAEEPRPLHRDDVKKSKVFNKSSDMTPVVDMTRERGTGATRSRRPIYVDLLPRHTTPTPIFKRARR